MYIFYLLFIGVLIIYILHTPPVVIVKYNKPPASLMTGLSLLDAPGIFNDGAEPVGRPGLFNDGTKPVGRPASLMTGLSLLDAPLHQKQNLILSKKLFI
jgi:hypothetical protein